MVMVMVMREEKGGAGIEMGKERVTQSSQLLYSNEQHPLVHSAQTDERMR